MRDRQAIKEQKTKTASEGHLIPSAMLSFNLVLKQKGNERNREREREKQRDVVKKIERYRERERKREKGVSSTELLCVEVSCLEDFRCTTALRSQSLFPIAQEELYGCTHTHTHKCNVIMLIEREGTEAESGFVLAREQRLQPRVKY